MEAPYASGHGQEGQISGAQGGEDSDSAFYAMQAAGFWEQVWEAVPAEDQERLSAWVGLTREELALALIDPESVSGLPDDLLQTLISYLQPQDQLSAPEIPPLPPEVWQHILSYLDPESLARLHQVSRDFQFRAEDIDLWRPMLAQLPSNLVQTLFLQMPSLQADLYEEWASPARSRIVTDQAELDAALADDLVTSVHLQREDRLSTLELSDTRGKDVRIHSGKVQIHPAATVSGISGGWVDIHGAMVFGIAGGIVRIYGPATINGISDGEVTVFGEGATINGISGGKVTAGRATIHGILGGEVEDIYGMVSGISGGLAKVRGPSATVTDVCGGELRIQYYCGATITVVGGIFKRGMVWIHGQPVVMGHNHGDPIPPSASVRTA